VKKVPRTRRGHSHCRRGGRKLTCSSISGTSHCNLAVEGRKTLPRWKIKKERPHELESNRSVENVTSMDESLNMEKRRIDVDFDKSAPGGLGTGRCFLRRGSKRQNGEFLEAMRFLADRTGLRLANILRRMTTRR